MATEEDLWRVRGEDATGPGHPIAFSRLAQAVADGIFGEEVQVRGPGEATWMLVGEHPLLEERLPRPAIVQTRSYQDAEMDMTPMIDVVFQLLIFFMITAAFVVQKTLDLPQSKTDSRPSAPTTMSRLKEDFIVVAIQPGPVITVNEQPVAVDGLAGALRRAARGRDTVEMVLDVDDQVEHETVVQALDAAGEAEIERVMFVRRVGAQGKTGPPANKS
jgi:biopolymer transport protein ExbD